MHVAAARNAAASTRLVDLISRPGILPPISSLPPPSPLRPELNCAPRSLSVCLRPIRITSLARAALTSDEILRCLGRRCRLLDRQHVRGLVDKLDLRSLDQLYELMRIGGGRQMVLLAP